MDTIALCDTEPVAIEGLRSLLAPEEGLRIVAAESSIMDGVDAIRELGPAMLVVDKAFGLHAVMDMLRTLRESGRPTAAVVWGYGVSDAESVRLVQLGAAGVLRKTASLDRVLECIRTVRAGGTWIDGSMAGRSETARGPTGSPLTARELQVVELVERGMKNKEIAQSLGIRIGTVKIHIKHIFEKTGIHGRYGLALSGLRDKIGRPAALEPAAAASCK